MDSIKKKLERINDIWSRYVLNYQHFHQHVAWDDEVRTNYFGDIIQYFNDTLDLIDRKPADSDFQNSIFYATSLLQVIYVHQDLTDELLRIFKIKASSLEDKNPNREIRNELIGHPVNRGTPDNGRKLKSTIFWSTNSTVGNIHYIRYASENNFLGEEVFYDVNSIIKAHHDYLNKYFDKIISKIRKPLQLYTKQLNVLEQLINDERDFTKIVEITFQRYEYISLVFNHYNEAILKECYKRRDEHFRYQYAVDKFKADLSECLYHTRIEIQKLISVIQLEDETPMAIINKKIVFNQIDSNIPSNEHQTEQNNNDRELGKLSEKNPCFGIPHFMKKYSNNPEIIAELENMQNNMNNNLEYYCSFEYLSFLIANQSKQ
jgi:hypothetical protein